MNLEMRGGAIVMLDLPQDFTLPEQYPVSWSCEHKAFAVPRRHPAVPALLRLLVDQGLLEELPVGYGRQLRRCS